MGAELRGLGWRVYVLPDDIGDVPAFFAAIMETVPLDPPLQGPPEGRFVWDALSDSLFSGLLDSEDDQIAILWPRSEVMVQGPYANFSEEREARNDYAIAREVLAQVVFQLWDPLTTSGEPTKMLLVVLT